MCTAPSSLSFRALFRWRISCSCRRHVSSNLPGKAGKFPSFQLLQKIGLPLKSGCPIRVNVCYTYLHLVDSYGKCSKNMPYIDPTGVRRGLKKKLSVVGISRDHYMKPTQTMHNYRGNQSKLPYLCIKFDFPQKWVPFNIISLPPKQHFKPNMSSHCPKIGHLMILLDKLL